MPDYDEKTEEPTSKRREEARQEGNIPKSQDLTSAILILGALALMGIVGKSMMHTMIMMTENSLLGSNDLNPTLTGDTWNYVARLFYEGIVMLAPIAFGIFALAIIANVIQVGFLITGKPLMPSFSKISPVKGLQQIFSFKGLMRFAMSMMKTFIVLIVGGILIWWDFEEVIGLLFLSSAQGFLMAAEMVYMLAWKIAALLFLIALLDYWFQKWQSERDLKMTKQEVKDEMRQMDGDPQVKRRRMMVARQLAMQRISAAVPQADVVVTNPTHYAIALKYDENTMPAPKVVAKGADLMALRIRQLAEQHGVEIHENKQLARALYSELEVGDEISEEYYQAVAEILASVYKINQDKQRKSA